MLSEKEGIAVDKLQSDLIDLVRSVISVKELGFSDLESLLRAIPDMCTVQQRSGTLTVLGVADHSTCHVPKRVTQTVD